MFIYRGENIKYYEIIKEILIKNEVYKKVKDYSKNKSDLNAYYEVERLIVEAWSGEARAKYGNRLIKEYSEKLTRELGKGYTISALKRMRQFYLMILKGATLSLQLTWSHYVEILKIYNLINMRLDKMSTWTFESISAKGTGKNEFIYTYTYQNQRLYVMEFDMNTVNDVINKIDAVEKEK